MVHQVVFKFVKRIDHEEADGLSRTSVIAMPSTFIPETVYDHIFIIDINNQLYADSTDDLKSAHLE